MTQPIYKANEQLRTNTAQELDDYLTMFAGYDTYEHLLHDVAQAFKGLGKQLPLDGQVRALRGETTETHHIADLAAGDVFRDDGYLFATLDEAVALHHMERHASRAPDGAEPLLLTLNLHSALYIPEHLQRSADLVALLDPHTHLRSTNARRRSVSQFVVPPGSRWRINAIRRDAPGNRVEAEATQL